MNLLPLEYACMLVVPMDRRTGPNSGRLCSTVQRFQSGPFAPTRDLGRWSVVHDDRDESDPLENFRRTRALSEHLDLRGPLLPRVAMLCFVETSQSGREPIGRVEPSRMNWKRKEKKKKSNCDIKYRVQRYTAGTRINYLYIKSKNCVYNTELYTRAYIRE